MGYFSINLLTSFPDTAKPVGFAFRYDEKEKIIKTKNSPYQKAREFKPAIEQYGIFNIFYHLPLHKKELFSIGRFDTP